MGAEQLEAAPSREDFLQRLAASGLSGVVADGPAAAPDPVASAATGPELARALIAAGKLTPYQADAILAGRYSDLRAGNYDILGRLGAGAMGAVYKARHRRMKRVVALKTLVRTGPDAKKYAARFQREVELIAQLIHPNIVIAFDADESDAGLFLVMEFVEGQDLASEVTDRGPLAPADAVADVIQAARGLEFAHANGLIHRDVKPANILRSVTGQVKVADLGLAKLSEDAHTGATSLTQAGGVVGTIDYMAPEQAVDSTTIDHRADQYALGCTLYFLLAGEPIYKGSSPMSVLLKHRDAPVPSLTALRPDVPAALDAVFRKMVAKRPDDRFPGMTDAIRALEAVALPLATGRSVVGHGPLPAGRPFTGSASASSQNIRTDVTQSFPGTTGEQGIAPSLAGRAVVLAEPSRTQAGIIRKYLEQLGITDVRPAASGAEALALAKADPALLVFSSMHLSDMTGVQLVRAVRADPALAAVGCVVASSESESELVAEVRGMARTAVTHKPFELVRLANALAQVVGPA